MSDKSNKNNIAQSVFEKNYQQLPESKKEILNQKYNCSICLEIIKYENPFLCYECQKIFHHSCLKSWSTRQKQLKKKLSCPNCRNELPFEQWKVLRNYDETRTKDAEILNQIGKSFNSNEFIDKSISLYKFIVNKINDIHKLLETQNNFKLNNLVEEFQSNLIKPSIDEISQVIIEELDLLEEYIINIKKSNIKKVENVYKNEIKLKYFPEEEGNQKIFGTAFVENNIDNISLIINGRQSALVEESYLNRGENNITMKIKNKLNNLSYMFSDCKSLYDIDELKFLNTEDVTDFSYMFENCQISNFNAIENWNTSKSETFQSMFSCCESITNINFLKNWNVSKCKDFSSLFYNCKKLSNIKSLENWNVSSGTNFGHIFSFDIISDIKPLENWDVSNATDLNGLFYSCENLTDISPLKSWNVSNCEDLRGILNFCENYLT